MEYRVDISCVSGDNRTLCTKDIKLAVQFLKAEDHEGSSISMIVILESEEVFDFFAKNGQFIG